MAGDFHDAVCTQWNKIVKHLMFHGALVGGQFIHRVTPDGFAKLRFKEDLVKCGTGSSQDIERNGRQASDDDRGCDRLETPVHEDEHPRQRFPLGRLQ